MPPETPWARAKKTKSQRQEERLAKMEGGRPQVNSGRLWRWKRDAILHNFLIEARTTDKESYRIEKKEFQQMRKDAMQTPPGLLPAMQIDMGDVHLMVCELQAFHELNMRVIELETQMEMISGDEA
jgi:hypothetical protein